MRTLVLLTLASLAFAGTATAVDEPVNPDEKGIFDFSDLDVPEPPPAERKKALPLDEDPLAGLPETIRTVLDKLDRFGSFKRAELNKEIAAARKIAAEILVRNAVKADAAGRESLLEEAKRVESLDPGVPLIETATASSSQASTSLRQIVGSWQCQKWGRWTAVLAPDGTLMRDQGAGGGTWRWMDEKRGVVLFIYP